MKRSLLLIFAAMVLLAGCGNTSKVDDMINNSESEAEVSLNEIDKAIADDAESFAADYWQGKDPTSVPEKQDLNELDTKNGDIDIDLTMLDSNMVYAQVFDMVNYSDKYIGKKVRAKGTFAHTVDRGNDFFAVLIADATACCAQGLEFVLAGEYQYPNDYPALDSEITIEGVFNTYEDSGFTYCQLKDAVLDTV